MTQPLAPLAAIVAVLLTGCNEEATDNERGPQVVPSQGTAQPGDAAQSGAVPVTVGLPCDSARLLKIRAVERAESRVGGPVPPTSEGEPRAVGPVSGTMYYLSLDCGGKAYVARVPGGTPGFQPEELEAAGTLRLRSEGGKIFLKSEAGGEFEAALSAVPTPESPPPG